MAVLLYPDRILEFGSADFWGGKYLEKTQFLFEFSETLLGVRSSYGPEILYHNLLSTDK